MIAPEEPDLAPEVARSVLQLGLSEGHNARMRELAASSGQGILTEGERAEMESYRRAGNLLSLWQATARLSLKRAVECVPLTARAGCGRLETEASPMQITREDLQDFHRFADARLAGGEGGSLVDLAREWESARQYEESLAAFRESHADAEAGRVIPLGTAFAEVRAKLGQTE